MNGYFSWGRTACAIAIAALSLSACVATSSGSVNSNDNATVVAQGVPGRIKLSLNVARQACSPPPANLDLISIDQSSNNGLKIEFWDAHNASEFVNESGIEAWLDRSELRIRYDVLRSGDPAAPDFGCESFSRIRAVIDQLPSSIESVKIYRSTRNDVARASFSIQNQSWERDQPIQ